MNIEVLALIATIVFVLIALFLIPMILQIRQTVQRVDELVSTAQREILPMVRDLREITGTLKVISEETEQDIKKVRPIFDSLEQAGEMIHNFTAAMNSGVGQIVGRSMGTWLGMRAAKKAVAKELSHSKRGGRKDG
jgi:uncharacterized protein YoxC